MSGGDYAGFLATKVQHGGEHGFAPNWMPDFLYPFQRALVEWATLRGRSAIFADCGLGKGPMSLVWAENVVRHTNRPVLMLTPLAVGYQLTRDAERKFGIACTRSPDGTFPAGARVVVTNYERLEHFRPEDFSGVVCDESSILKNFDGSTKARVTKFARTLPYRLLCTATAAPNDYVELGTSSEALGELGHMDMLARFFKNDLNTCDTKATWRASGGGRQGWRFKRHAEIHFWRWVCSWARAVRRPSDLGFDDGSFALPALEEFEHVVKARASRPGYLFDLPAENMREEREERRRTIEERCERMAELARHDDQVLVWCHLNDEGNRLEKAIPGAVQASGSDSDDEKEEKLLAFADGKVRALVTKPKIGAWGLNLQGCAHVATFVSHSYEQYYQGIRRCWRFGQTRPVRVDIIASEGEHGVVQNLRRKAEQADRMFTALVEHMNDARRIDPTRMFSRKEEVPSWLSQSK